MKVQEESSVTKALLSQDGEVEAIGQRILKMNTGDTVQFLNDEIH